MLIVSATTLIMLSCFVYSVLFHFNTGWCSFFLLDWQQSAFYFDQLLHMHPSGAYNPPASSGLKKHSAAELKLIEDEKALLHPNLVQQRPRLERPLLASRQFCRWRIVRIESAECYRPVCLRRTSNSRNRNAREPYDDLG